MRKNLPAARAVRGEMASHKGIDYRDTAVIYTAKKVPDTPWLMVAKIDEAEILFPLRRLVLITGCIYWLIMTAVGILLYRHLDLRRNVEVRREQDLEAATGDLNLRIKELNCLYAISSIAEQHSDALPDMMAGIVNLLPLAWQYPEITCAKITIEDEGRHPLPKESLSMVTAGYWGHNCVGASSRREGRR